MAAAAKRLFDLLAQLPTQQRVAIALALADFSQELLTAAPPRRLKRETELEQLAALEVELQDLPKGERIEAIRKRLNLPRSTYFHKRKQAAANNLLASLKVSRNPANN